jgi:hypothetical protein
MLTDDHKMKRIGSALKYLMRYVQERDDFLDFIVTGNEKCGFYHTLESKQQFDDDDEVQEEVMTWFKWLAADFYESGIQKLVPSLNKCLHNAGDYVENKIMYRQFIHGVILKIKHSMTRGYSSCSKT